MFTDAMRILKERNKEGGMRCEGIIFFDLNIEHVFDVITPDIADLAL